MQCFSQMTNENFPAVEQADRQNKVNVILALCLVCSALDKPDLFLCS